MCWAGFSGFAALFCVADVLFFIAVVLISQMDVDVGVERLETESLSAGLSKLVRLIDVDVFLVMMLLLGTCWGYLESFLFLFLKELNAKVSRYSIDNHLSFRHAPSTLFPKS